MNIVRNLEHSANFYGERTAIIFEDQKISYDILHRKVNQLSAGMRKMGIQKGDRVALFMPNIPEFIIVYYSIQKLGAIAVSLNAMLVKNEVEYILEDCAAKIIFAGTEQIDQVPLQKVKSLSRIILVEGDTDDDRHINWFYDTETENFSTVETNNDDPSAILYTSGTTGFPKGATLSHFNVISNVNAVIYHIRSRKDDILHLFLPLFHCFGQNFIMNSAIKKGAAIVMHRRFEPDPVIEAVTKHKVTMFFAVPTIYIYLLNMKDKNIDFSGVRFFFTAAASMPLEVAESWKNKYGIPIHDGYGLTECAPFAAYNHDYKHKPGSIGHPIINSEIKIVKPNGTLAATGEWGEICIKGPSVMKGYWNRPEETSKAIINGWLHTGDVGIQDENGDFFIVDRVKDMIISAGNNIYPTEIENHLYSHPAVHEAAVFGIPDEIKGEAVKAAIVLRPGESITAEEMISFCRERMSKYKVPKQIEFIQELPKSPTGKILKRVLRDEV